jgi:hypothetical protein
VRLINQNFSASSAGARRITVNPRLDLYAQLHRQPKSIAIVSEWVPDQPIL